MSVRERILTIQLLEKIARQPVYAAAIGIEIVEKTPNSDDSEESF